MCVLLSFSSCVAICGIHVHVHVCIVVMTVVCYDDCCVIALCYVVCNECETVLGQSSFA